MAQIFFAGFSAGLLGGKSIKPILSKIIKVFDLWNAPFSNTIILNYSGFCAKKHIRKLENLHHCSKTFLIEIYLRLLGKGHQTNTVF